MLRALGAFLLVFCLLSVVVQQEAMARLFGIVSVLLFGIDLLSTKHASGDRASRTRAGSILQSLLRR